MEELVWNIAIYSSLLGFVLLIFALLTGLRIIKSKPAFKVHKKIAITAFILIGFHAFVMIYSYFFS